MRPAHAQQQTKGSRSPVTIRALIQFCFFSDSPDRFVLKGFSKDGRDLTDKETRAFLKAADKDGDGKIGVDGKRPVPLVAVGRGGTQQGQCANAQRPPASTQGRSLSPASGVLVFFWGGFFRCS